MLNFIKKISKRKCKIPYLDKIQAKKLGKIINQTLLYH